MTLTPCSQKEEEGTVLEELREVRDDGTSIILARDVWQRDHKFEANPG